jgi:hypothetical protein
MQLTNRLAIALIPATGCLDCSVRAPKAHDHDEHSCGGH